MLYSATWEGKTNQASCLMAMVPWTIADDVRRLALSIPDSELFHDDATDSGRELDTHATVVYGIETTDVEEVYPFLMQATCSMSKLTWFHRPEKGYHVLVFEVESADLIGMNRKIRSSLANVQTFDSYIPHVTLAYIRDGSNLEFIEKSIAAKSGTIIGQRFVVSEYEFSSRDGSSYSIVKGASERIARAVAMDVMAERVASASTQKGRIAVDFDGTLATYDGWKGPASVGEPIIPMLRRVLDWLTHGKDVVIFTARAGDPAAVAAIKKWCMEHIGRELEVTNVKSPDMIEFWE